ncbi:hypothetical protein STEG23_029186, partial [Scotinomys teguina]
MCRLSWFLDPGGWSKTAAVGLYFIFPGICTLSLDHDQPRGVTIHRVPSHANLGSRKFITGLHVGKSYK